MNSPFVRRKRLAAEIRSLREAQGFNHSQLGDKARLHRLKISRLETGERAPNITDVMKILTALGVEGDQWHQLVRIAEDAAEKGWWTQLGKGMGRRQQLIADLEAGARHVHEYQIFVIPALLQTRDYALHRGEQTNTGRSGHDVSGHVEGRKLRQRMFFRTDGPEYDVILDEPAIRRLTAPPPVMAAQLRHLADVATTEARTRVRVLPLDARISGYQAPRSPFTLFRYPDPGDPIVAAVDTETTDLILTRTDEVRPYLDRFDRLWEASLSVEESRGLIAEIADALSRR